MMKNIAAASGENLQMVLCADKAEEAYEIGVVSHSQPKLDPQPLFSSLPRLQLALSKTTHTRRFRYRDLNNLKPDQVHQLHVADTIANLKGLPLNIFMSIFWLATIYGEQALPLGFAYAMKRMNQWLRDNGIKKPSYVYVHENPQGKKLNTHLLIHVPSRLLKAFKGRADKWFDALNDDAVLVEARNDARRSGNRLQYMAKGANYCTCQRYGGYRAKGGQGPISVKRSGVAQCLRPDRKAKPVVAL